jgi:pimeloyl-ACP methyl ester carboxylesterase
MPLVSPNPQPVVDFPRFGAIRLQRHNQLRLLEGRTEGHPVHLLVAPVITFLNHVEKAYGYQRIALIGLSGGGWTTVLAAAIDPRIDLSVHIASSYPLYLKSLVPSDWGDYEQNTPDLYRTVNYLELYLLGAYGAGRRALQVVNVHDTCCYGGNGWETYAEIVSSRSRTLGSGTWDLVPDRSSRHHSISVEVRELLLSEIAELNLGGSSNE